jgi:ubiquinone/menaquinone biosynthesis C-methylase UbiE
MNTQGAANPLDARLSQEEVKDVYNSAAKIYDVWGLLTEGRARKRALQIAQIVNGESVLEVAVGTALMFKEIVKRNPDGTNIGIDISNGMLEKARKRMASLGGAHYELRIGDAFEIPFPDNEFDLLVNNYMFDLIPFSEMGRILSEFRRVLKAKGRLVLVNMTESESPGGNLYRAVYRLFPKALGGCRGVKMSDRLAGAGFDVIKREYHQQLLFPSEVILATNT